MRDFTDWDSVVRSLEQCGVSRFVKERCPILVIGIQRGDRGLCGITQGKHPFVSISHQTAGVACHTVEIDGIVLRPRPRAFAAMQLIEDHWRGSSMGASRTRLDDIVYYRMQVKNLLNARADCDVSYDMLEEGVYPIDPMVPVIRELCEDDLPDDLDDLLEFDSPVSRILGSMDRWRCLILSANSD
jgi:hypothetical protein